MTASIIVVDDSLTVRMDLVEAFQRAGMEAEPCASIAEARAAIARGGVRLAVLDVVLPDGDGIDLLRELRDGEATRDVHVLLLSSEAEVKDRIRGLRTGADEYLGKPYDSAHVIARAAELVGASLPGAREERAILVIEDSPTFRDRVARSLSGAGYGVVTAESGEAGLRAAAAARPLAILVDDVLPGIDGATVIRRVRLDGVLRSTPCVLLTGSEVPGAELRALEAGADAFVRKEGDFGVLLARLSVLLRERPSAVVPEARSVLGPTKVLAVDDSATYLHELAEVLRADGYDVTLARSGEEALDLLAVQPVDCVLLDLIMPGLGGRETCQRIKGSTVARDTPVIILTSLEDRSAMLAGLVAGADDYISKSADFEVLRARVRAQLRRKQFEKEARRAREDLLRAEVEAGEARAARELAETKAALAAELEQKNRALDAASSAKTEFLASMSHELRTPLNAILGFAQLLARDTRAPLNERQKEWVAHVLKGGEHLLRLIDEVLDLAKIETRRIAVSPEPVAVPELLAEVVTTLGPMSAASRIDVSVEPLPPDLAAIRADRTRVRQVLLNLGSNAIKYNRPGGRVRIRAGAGQAPDTVRIVVADTGLGIAPGKQGRVFEAFQRLGHETGSIEGTGIGLALSKRIAEMMGGTVGFTSAAGVGSEFWIELPVSRELASSVPPARDRSPRAGQGPQRVLYVEDNPANVALMEAIFSELDRAQLVTAPSAEVALEVVHVRVPDLVILDINLPGMSGYQALEALRRISGCESVPVIALTAAATDDDRRRGEKAGFTRYLTKPLQVADLLDVLDELSAGA